MIVEMYMNKDVKIISPEASLVEATRKMFQHQIRRLVVTIGESVIGIVCYRDLANAFPDHINPFSAFGLAELNLTTKIREIMKYPVITVDPSEPIERAAWLMTKHRIGVLPVTSKEKLVGIITESDIFRIFTNLLSGEVGSVRITFDLTESENVLFLICCLKFFPVSSHTGEQGSVRVCRRNEQQDQGHPKKGLRFKRRALSSAKNLHVYAQGDMN